MLMKFSKRSSGTAPLPCLRDFQILWGSRSNFWKKLGTLFPHRWLSRPPRLSLFSYLPPPPPAGDNCSMSPTRFSALSGSLVCLLNPVFALLVTRLWWKKLSQNIPCMVTRQSLTRHYATNSTSRTFPICITEEFFQCQKHLRGTG